ncbi:hypothetical protein LE181_02970 [Streptomyces sp. SCA3-4]|uniref:hypothetical protein n=1 Tax=Streptomyces sichuanensis TaxID=2871810 RepID=UPI001CE37E88|nr:hypothetical protein [Streptomyces sichuanensis]MCA6091132.1 hypothetical protein [Streptomyces sichuanensis]
MIESTAPALVDALLVTLDPLPFPQRVRHIARWARERRAGGELGAVLAELSERGGYEQGIAASAAGAGRDVVWLQNRLTDPDPAVRVHAVAAVRDGLISDAAVTAALDDAPLAIRRQIVRAVVAGRRTALADALVRPVRERWGDAEAAKLLPACRPATVEELLPVLFHTAVPWGKLAAHHSPAVLDEAERRLAALSEDHRRRWWQAYGSIVAATIEAQPLRVLDLLERLCPGALPEPVHRRLGRLAAADPGGTLRLLVAPGREDGDLHRLKPSVLRVLVRHRPPGFDAFGRAMGRDERALVRLLKAMAPSRRAEFYDVAMNGRSMGHAALSHGILDVLPRARREAEARRMAGQAREYGGSRQSVLSAMAYLPVAEARPELLAATRRSEPTERAYAYKLLVRNAALARDPAALTELLAGLDRLRNEQQPVRSAFLAALADVRPTLFAQEAAPHLERLTTDTVEARDFSWPESHALRTLARGVLREQTDAGDDELTGWALRTVARLQGAAPSREDLRPGQEHDVFAALRPSLEAAADRADFTETLRLAATLRELGHGIPGLQALLRRAIEHGTPDDGRRAVDHWLDDPRTRDDRLTELLALEPSAATLSRVQWMLVCRRTDLLDTVLGDTPPYGRFLIEGSHVLPPVCRDARYWLPRQQAAAVRLLERAAGDDNLTMHERVQAVRMAAWLPGHGTGLLLRYADDGNVPLAEAALAALARTEGPGRHLRLLLSHAGGDRARVAVPAASRASRFVAPSALAGELRGLLTSTSGVKVTSRKEAARLAATALPAPQAVALLTEACTRPGQHHDVQAACVAFTKGLLAHEEAWGLLETAAAGRRELRMTVLASRPGDLPERHRRRYAALVRAVCDTDDPEVARDAYAALGTWSPWAPDATEILEAAVTDLDNRASWHHAADALCDVVALAPSGTPDPAPLTRTLTALIAADALPGAPDAEPDRDRPAHRRLRRLTLGLAARSTRHPRAVRETALAVSEVLGDSGDYGPEAAELLVRTLDPDAAPDGLTSQLERLARFHEGRPALAARTAGSLVQRLGTRHGSDGALAHAARSLTADGGHAAGLFAVALTTVGGGRTNWSAAWREQLRVLRRHACADVRDEARATTTAEE